VTQHDIDALRDAIIQNTVNERPANLIAAAVEAYVAPIAADRDRLRVAWTSARRGRAQAKAGVDYLLQEVETAMAAVEQLTKERDGLVSELASAESVVRNTKALMERRTGTLRARAERAEQDRAELRQTLWAAIEAAARSMRDRALAAIQPRWDLQPEAQAEAVEAIAALPLLAADTTGPTVTHADLPEAVTPCGHGSQDVTTTTRVSEVTCLGCLRALAQAAHGDRLPEEDLVEPGDEVPALAELADRVTALEERLSPPTKLAAFASEPPGPARYRDRHGDIWEDKGDGRVGLAVVGSRDVELVSAFPFAQAEASWGPLVRVGAVTGGAE
jgi:hypothetical protein